MRHFIRQAGLLMILILLSNGLLLLSIHTYRISLHDQICKSIAPNIDRESNVKAIIISGSSTVANGINRNRLHQEFRLPVITIAEPAFSPSRNYFSLQKIIRPGDVVIQSYDPWVYLKRYSTIHDERLISLSLCDKISVSSNPIRQRSLLGIIQTHYFSIFNLIATKIKSKNRRTIQDYECNNGNYKPENRLHDFFEEPEIDRTQLIYLNQIRELCGNVGAQFIMVYPPKSQSYLTKSEIAENLINKSMPALKAPECMVYDTTALFDDFHVNCKGASLFTEGVIELIRAFDNKPDPIFSNHTQTNIWGSALQAEILTDTINALQQP